MFQKLIKLLAYFLKVCGWAVENAKTLLKLANDL
jgi:hypothetical protein